jgi:hypothetical protein
VRCGGRMREPRTPRLSARQHRTTGREIGGYGARSILEERGEVPFGGAVPAHPWDRVLPAALRLFAGGRVRGVTTGDHLLELPVLGLDDLVCGLTVGVGNRMAHGVACMSSFPSAHCFLHEFLRSWSLARPRRPKRQCALRQPARGSDAPRGCRHVSLMDTVDGGRDTHRVKVSKEGGPCGVHARAGSRWDWRR